MSIKYIFVQIQCLYILIPLTILVLTNGAGCCRTRAVRYSTQEDVIRTPTTSVAESRLPAVGGLQLQEGSDSLTPCSQETPTISAKSSELYYKYKEVLKDLSEPYRSDNVLKVIPEISSISEFLQAEHQKHLAILGDQFDTSGFNFSVVPLMKIVNQRIELLAEELDQQLARCAESFIGGSLSDDWFIPIFHDYISAIKSQYKFQIYQSSHLNFVLVQVCENKESMERMLYFLLNERFRVLEKRAENVTKGRSSFDDGSCMQARVRGLPTSKNFFDYIVQDSFFDCAKYPRVKQFMCKYGESVRILNVSYFELLNVLIKETYFLITERYNGSLEGTPLRPETLDLLNKSVQLHSILTGNRDDLGHPDEACDVYSILESVIAGRPEDIGELRKQFKNGKLDQRFNQGYSRLQNFLKLANELESGSIETRLARLADLRAQDEMARKAKRNKNTVHQRLHRRLNKQGTATQSEVEHSNAETQLQDLRERTDLYWYRRQDKPFVATEWSHALVLPPQYIWGSLQEATSSTTPHLQEPGCVAPNNTLKQTKKEQKKSKGSLYSQKHPNPRNKNKDAQVEESPDSFLPDPMDSVVDNPRPVIPQPIVARDVEDAAREDAGEPAAHLPLPVHQQPIEEDVEAEEPVPQLPRPGILQPIGEREVGAARQGEGGPGPQLLPPGIPQPHAQEFDFNKDWLLAKGLRLFHPHMFIKVYPLLKLNHRQQHVVNSLFNHHQQQNVTFKAFQGVWEHIGGKVVCGNSGTHRLLIGPSPHHTKVGGVFVFDIDRGCVSIIPYLQTYILYVGLRPVPMD